MSRCLFVAEFGKFLGALSGIEVEVCARCLSLVEDSSNFIDLTLFDSVFG